MEQIIRPFQLQDPAATTRIPVVIGQVTVQPAHICWGGVGQLPTAVLQADTFNGINFRVEECDDQNIENSRDQETFRVFQNNDSSSENWVDVARVRRIDFKRTSKQHFLGVFHTDTTDFGLTDFFAGSGFGDLPEQVKCRANFSLNRP
jgi:hypothetical protein